MGSGIGSSAGPDLAAALHRLRSTLARLKSELELAAEDGTDPDCDLLLGDVREALGFLSEAEEAVQATPRVLVVDDDRRLAEITARGLRRLGFAAEAGDELRALRRNEVLVLDLGLVTALDDAGLASVRAARPVIVTGATDSVSRSLAASLHASDVLLKPVEPEALAGAVRRRIEEA